MKDSELMSDKDFKLMNYFFKIIDFLFPYVNKRAKTFGIKEGMTIIDYGCGPGRYTIPFAKLVGEKGKVVAVDIKDLALREVEKKIKKYGINNIDIKLAKGNESGIESGIADMVFAIDMFFKIKDHKSFLQELSRISKENAVLVIDDGHQSRKTTKEKIGNAGAWTIIEEKKDHLKCKKNI
jgi:ubiquinone/menaquinone biosynthesis C-methylase UbiE